MGNVDYASFPSPATPKPIKPAKGETEAQPKDE